MLPEQLVMVIEQTSTILLSAGGMININKHHDAFGVRASGPRTFKPLRQRARSRFCDTREQFTRWTVKESMAKEFVPETQAEDLIDRETLCLPNFASDSIIHGGDAGFKHVLQQYFPIAESNASERLVALKKRLRNAATEDFWGDLMEEMCDITGSQCGFVAKRILVDDIGNGQDSVVEMPELGEEGSCLMGVAFYVNNGADVKKLYRDYRYHAYGTPCAYMKHDKVFIVPERMTEFIPNNPNPMPWKKSEAYIGLPLFAEGICFAHFGMIWSEEGAAKRKLGWSFLEMFMHSLEDLILQRILEGRGFVKKVASPESTPAKIIPLSAITAHQSLKPYAQSLSHELRTPMQGVVGMLDIMYSTVLDAISNQQNERVRSVFENLKDHIEVVQDSSRRAVDAADNVVHAYDHNMQMPETPLTPVDDSRFVATKTRLSPYTALPAVGGNKRLRSDNHELNPGPPPKRMLAMTEADIFKHFYQSDSTTPANETPSIISTKEGTDGTSPMSDVDFTSQKESTEFKGSPVTSPAFSPAIHRRIVLRDFVSSLITDALRSVHPTSEVTTTTELGEIIVIQSRGSEGEVQERTIQYVIDLDVPDAIITHEQHVQFALQKVIDNAVKFTESGSITISVGIGKQGATIDFLVEDTGCGIAEDFKGKLFATYSQGDPSIRRRREGLGLSLFNAKAHVRKYLGGDITLERTATEGSRRGSEFLIRLPASSLEEGSVRTPRVGSPIPTGPQRPLPWADPVSHSNPSSSESLATSTSTPRRRTAINSKLGNEYPLNILIAEDNAINRNVAIGQLTKLGYSDTKITVAHDGLQAVKLYEESLCKAPSERFTAIFMDIWMPNMDGYEATKKIMELARAKGERTTIVAVTADITKDSLDRAKDAGMLGFLTKPTKLQDLEHMIKQNFPRK